MRAFNGHGESRRNVESPNAQDDQVSVGNLELEQEMALYGGVSSESEYEEAPIEKLSNTKRIRVIESPSDDNDEETVVERVSMQSVAQLTRKAFSEKKQSLPPLALPPLALPKRPVPEASNPMQQSGSLSASLQDNGPKHLATADEVIDYDGSEVGSIDTQVGVHDNKDQQLTIQQLKDSIAAAKKSLEGNEQLMATVFSLPKLNNLCLIHEENLRAHLASCEERLAAALKAGQRKVLIVDLTCDEDLNILLASHFKKNYKFKRNENTIDRATKRNSKESMPSSPCPDPRYKESESGAEPLLEAELVHENAEKEKAEKEKAANEKRFSLPIQLPDLVLKLAVADARMEMECWNDYHTAGKGNTTKDVLLGCWPVLSEILARDKQKPRLMLKIKDLALDNKKCNAMLAFVHASEFLQILKACPRLIQLSSDDKFYTPKVLDFKLIEKAMAFDSKKRAGSWTALCSMMVRDNDSMSYTDGDAVTAISLGFRKIHCCAKAAAFRLHQTIRFKPTSADETSLSKINNASKYLLQKVLALSNSEATTRAPITDTFEFFLKKIYHTILGAFMMAETALLNKSGYSDKGSKLKLKSSFATSVALNGGGLVETKKWYEYKKDIIGSTATFFALGIPSWWCTFNNRRLYTFLDTFVLFRLARLRFQHNYPKSSDGLLTITSPQPWANTTNFIMDVLIEARVDDINNDWNRATEILAKRVTDVKVAQLFMKDIYEELYQQGSSLSTKGTPAPRIKMQTSDEDSMLRKLTETIQDYIQENLTDLPILSDNDEPMDERPVKKSIPVVKRKISQVYQQDEEENPDVLELEPVPVPMVKKIKVNRWKGESVVKLPSRLNKGQGKKPVKPVHHHQLEEEEEEAEAAEEDELEEEPSQVVKKAKLPPRLNPGKGKRSVGKQVLFEEEEGKEGAEEEDDTNDDEFEEGPAAVVKKVTVAPRSNRGRVQKPRVKPVPEVEEDEAVR